MVVCSVEKVIIKINSIEINIFMQTNYLIEYVHQLVIHNEQVLVIYKYLQLHLHILGMCNKTLYIDQRYCVFHVVSLYVLCCEFEDFCVFVSQLLFYGMCLWMGCIILFVDIILGLKCFLNLERVYNVILFAGVVSKYLENG